MKTWHLLCPVEKYWRGIRVAVQVKCGGCSVEGWPLGASGERALYISMMITEYALEASNLRECMEWLWEDPTAPPSDSTLRCKILWLMRNCKNYHYYIASKDRWGGIPKTMLPWNPRISLGLSQRLLCALLYPCLEWRNGFGLEFFPFVDSLFVKVELSCECWGKMLSAEQAGSEDSKTLVGIEFHH